MNKRIQALFLAFLLLLSLAFGCKGKEAEPAAPANVAADGETFAFPENETDFGLLRTPGSQEAAYAYKAFFLPAQDGTAQPYVGDTMPYYEDGTYYIYYLKEGGDSYNHSIYLATTKDFVTYTEKDDVVLEASRAGGQDGWIGTGSVVKVKDTYYFFYTGHAFSDSYEFKEKILVAKGSSLTSFEKVADWEIVPPSELGQKNDFRDPQAYYDEATDTITLTVTAAQSNKARILKFTLSGDLTTITYDGIIFTDPTASFWNLECSDTFKMGDNGADTYMVGWARRSESVSSTQDVNGWAGNLAVQQLLQNPDGSLYLAPVSGVIAQHTARRQLLVDSMETEIAAGSAYNYADLFTAYESYVLTGTLKFEKTGSFGLAFDYNGRQEKYKTIVLDPAKGTLSLQFNEGSTLITETAVQLEAGKEYTFTYIQEGSVGVFYLDGLAALTVRLYGVSGKPVKLFAENNTVTFSALKQYTR